MHPNALRPGRSGSGLWPWQSSPSNWPGLSSPNRSMAARRRITRVWASATCSSRLPRGRRSAGCPLESRRLPRARTHCSRGFARCCWGPAWLSVWAAGESRPCCSHAFGQRLEGGRRAIQNVRHARERSVSCHSLRRPNWSRDTTNEKRCNTPPSASATQGLN